MSSIRFLSTVLFLVALEPIAAVHYRVIDRTDRDPEKSKFRSLIGYYNAARGFTYANELVLRTLSLKPGVPRYDEVRLIIQSFREYGLGGYPASVASTVGNEIRINTDYLEAFWGDMYKEFMGIVIHETTHVWQWDGKGMAPRGLINGIADFVRLSTGWPSTGWTQQRGSGSRWNEGYAVTAYFLEYCNGLKSGFVSELNAMMEHYYSDDFFRRLLGKGVHELWEDYMTAYKSRYKVLSWSTNPSYAQPMENVMQELNLTESDSSEGYLESGEREDLTVAEISAQNEHDLDIKDALNSSAIDEKVKILPHHKSLKKFTSTAEDQSEHRVAVHCSHICTGFKDCLASALNYMKLW